MINVNFMSQQEIKKIKRKAINESESKIVGKGIY